MHDKINQKSMEKLCSAFLSLNSADECRRFLDDLCTVTELKALCQRFEVALMLADKAVYTDIVEQTGASTATISRVNRSLHYGMDGYTTVLARVKGEQK